MLLGVRKCNPELVHCATAKISQLFYGRNHPIYQNIIYHKMLDHILMPAGLQKITNDYISGSKNLKIGKCQGGDALLEELNKESKSWLKMAGIPSNDLWTRVFRNLDELTKVLFFSSNINFNYQLQIN